ncbi:DUF790 family protein [Pirellulaceae bacterium SH449]
MLTRELAISKIVRRQIIPDRLTRATHAEYGPLSEELVAVYESGAGKKRGVLHKQVRDLLIKLPQCPPKRIDAFCKLLDERCEYVTDSKGESAKLRREVFRLASKYQPITSQRSALSGTLESEAKQRIAAELNRSWQDIADHMFLDLPENHTLKAFRKFDRPMGLLARYNVAQTQVVLYDAVSLEIQASSDLKQIIRFAKLARLMHRIHRDGNGYRIELDGPASLLQRTTRYGVAMARFLPGLLSCKGWSANAVLKKPKWGQLNFHLDDRSGLTSEVEPDSEFDSQLEETFFQDWEQSETRGWTLQRESEILHSGQQVFIPDFVAQNLSGHRILIEIVGFWTPEYLSHKKKTIEQFRAHKIVLLVQAQSSAKFEALGTQRLMEYKTKIVISKLVDLLESL